MLYSLYRAETYWAVGLIRLAFRMVGCSLLKSAATFSAVINSALVRFALVGSP
jgi:hypothetical protein